MLSTLVSLVIVWSEVTFSIPRPQLSIFAIFVYTSHQNSSYAGILVRGAGWMGGWGGGGEGLGGNVVGEVGVVGEGRDCGRGEMGLW